MSRRGFVTTNRVLALTIVTLCVTTFLPSRLLAWTREPGRVVQRLTSPPADAVKAVGDQLSRAEPATNPDAAIAQIDELRRQNLALQLENERLRDENAALRGVERTVQTSMQLIPARIISETSSPSGRLLRANAGVRDGVQPGSVAATRGSHLLGRIVDLDQAMCHILPITDRNAGTFEVITTTESNELGIRFDLTPTGEGTLRGPGRYETEGLDQTPRRVEVGQLVSLSDETWSAHAGLIVGEIIAVEPAEQSPLRQVITVRPSIDTRRVGSVVIRVPGDGS